MTADQQFRTFLRELCQALEIELSGLAPAEIDAVEKRLGFRLPPSLRDFYELIGRTTLAVESSQRLHSPEQLVLKGRHLVYMVEEQGVCFYGIEQNELGATDPQVFQGNFDSDDWFLFSRSLRSHLATTLCWNCVYISHSGGQSEISIGKFRRLQESLPTLPFQTKPLNARDAVVLWSGKIIVVGFPKDEDCQIYVRAGSDEELEEFENKHAIEINWF